MVESKSQKIDDFIKDLESEAPSNKAKYEGTISKFLKTCGVNGKNFDEVWKNSTLTDKKLVVGIYDWKRDFKVFQEELKNSYKQLEKNEITKESLQERFELVESEEEEEQKLEQIDSGKKQQVEELKTTVEKMSDSGKKQQVEELKTTVEKMSDSGKKIMQPEVKKLEDRLSQIEKQSSSSSSSQKTALIKCDKYFDDFHKDLQKKMEKMNQQDTKLLSAYLNQEKFSTKSQIFNIERVFSGLIETHPKTMNKFSDLTASFSNTFRSVPGGSFIDPMWFRINKKRAKIYDRVKQIEKQQMLTSTEHNKLLYKEATRNGSQHGADLAVVENRHGIEEYRVKYPTIDQMLNTTLVQQYAFDLAQKRHLTFVQTNLLNDILKAGGSIVVPNIEFLKEAYQNKQSRGEDYQKEFQEYQNALISQIGKQVAYNGEQQWKVDVSVPTKNFTAPALQQPLQKPTMIDVSDVLLGIDHMVDYISKLSGNLNQLQLSKYKQVDDVFSSSIVTRKEPTTFKPQPGMAFKLRELMC